MKKFKYIITIFSALCLFAGCMDSFDDIKSNNKVSVDDVWNDESAIVGVLANMYNSQIFEDFSYFYGDYSWRSMDLVAMSDEGTAGFQKEPAFDQAGGVYEYPDEFLGSFIYIQGDQGGENIIRKVYSESYSLIRKCNDFLDKVATAPVEEDEKNDLIGEVKFLRAMAYFTLVKRYGGVPIIDKPQQYTGDITKLQIPRSSESATWDFVISEAKAAAELLPQTRSTGAYRATKWAALALCSRAALYAGSIAKYGTVGFGKLTGIDPDKANDYYKIAYETSKEVIDSHVYALFDKDSDKTENYRLLFVTKNNGEYIFQKAFSVASDMGNSYDKKHLPYSECRWGSITPTLEMAEAYEYLDGSDGKMKIDKEYSNINEIYQGKDPRFLASIYVPGQSFLGTTMQFQRGIIKADGSKYLTQSAPGPTYAAEYYTDPASGKKYQILGKDGGAYTGDASKTGFYVRKFIDEKCSTEAQWEFGKGETSWPIFRLAEMYLNLAEASVEMGDHQGEALEAINAIRDRAGVAKVTSVNIENVRHERQVELAFENHRFWDMKRWRIASKPASQGGLNGFRGKGLDPYFDINTDKYKFEYADDLPKRRRLFQDKNYYTKFSSEDMNSNPLLVQNPGFVN